MKILLQDSGSSLYLKGAKQWTPSPERAYPFPDTLAALRYCKRQANPNLQIVLHRETARKKRHASRKVEARGASCRASIPALA